MYRMTRVGPNTVFVVRFEMFAPGGIRPCKTSTCPSSTSAKDPLVHCARDRLYSAREDRGAENTRRVVATGTVYAVSPSEELFISSKLRPPQAIGPGRSHAGMTITPMGNVQPELSLPEIFGGRTRRAAPVRQMGTSPAGAWKRER